MKETRQQHLLFNSSLTAFRQHIPLIEGSIEARYTENSPEEADIVRER